MRSIIVPLALMMLALSGSGAGAAEVSREDYLRLVPLDTPRLVQQTEASASLNLYGDPSAPGYRDVDPRDGIDDRRHAVLMDLAVRFAPYLVQNTSEFPTNFDVYIENRDTFPLQLDTWDVTRGEPELLKTELVDFARLGSAECDRPAPLETLVTRPGATTDPVTEDCKLLELIHRFGPGASHVAADPRVQPRPKLVHILFFNFPGEGPENWKQNYEPEYRRSPPDRQASFPHAYVHPFLRAVRGEDGSVAGYEIILQYWFFYPSNDSGMNHEGDWEHLNVVISPRSHVEAPLTAELVDRILTGEEAFGDDAPDPLVIRRLDYYFHHSVMTLDFARPNVYRPRDEWKAQVKNLPQTRFQESEIWAGIRHLAYVDDDETVINTHPLGYIGADNKGLDQLLAPPGGKNRNPHGTFPFPGRYRDVGPGGTTDQISVYVDPRKYWKRLAAGKATEGPEFRRGRVLGLADPARLRIVPDWERVDDLVKKDARARREWAWLVLPIRWGYPATESPFTGILEHFDTGNLSIPGPSYNGGWNQSGGGPGFVPYDPHTLPSVFPLGPQDSFRNDLGFLNAPLVLLNLPPLDFATRIVAYPFKVAFERRDPVYYPKEGIPFRFVGISTGASLQAMDEDFELLALNAQHFDQFLFNLAFHFVSSGGNSTTVVTGGGDFIDDPVVPFLQIPFYIGGRFTSENTVRNVRTAFGVSLEFNNIPSYSYRADLELWEYAGSIRYSLSTSRLQPYVKGGYGWVWTRLTNVQANGVPFEPASSDWIEPASLWPNVWHFGGGIEFIPWKRTGRYFRGTEIALRLEYARYIQDLGLDLSGIPLNRLGLLYETLGDLPGGDRVTRDDFLFGFTMSF